jgi:hypothetical protein
MIIIGEMINISRKAIKAAIESALSAHRGIWDGPLRPAL